MSRLLYRIGHRAARHPWRTIGAWLVLAVFVVGLSGAVGRELEDDISVPGLDSQEAIDLLEAAGSSDAGLTAQLVVTPADASMTFFDDDAASAAARDELADLAADLAALPNVVSVADPAAALAAGPDETVAAGLVSPDGRVALVRAQYPGISEVGPGDLENLEELVADAGIDSALRVEVGSDLYFHFGDAGAGSELVGLVAAAVILLVAFGSLVAMGLPIGVALFGLALGTSSMALITYLVEIPSWAPELATMVGLGVGIDYALFLVTRHREHLAAGLGVEESAARAVATAGQAVVFAGGTVVVSILGLAVAGIPFVTAGGIAISTVVAVMVAASITLLPAFLGLAGGWIDRLGPPRARRSVRRDGPGHGWQRWGDHVSRHAPWYAVGVTALLLVSAAPVLALRLGFPDDGTLPESRTQRRAYDLVAEGFGPGVNGPFVIAVDISDDATVVEPLRDAIAADPGVAGVAEANVDTAAGVASFAAIPTTAPQDAATLETIDRLRADVFPAVLDGHDATAHVGGQTASFADVGERVKDRLALFVAAVVALSFVLLMVVFRSVLVPLKAAILNLLSIGAAYGVLVAVFQWEWGASLIGLEGPVPIVSFIPMFMFAIVFGLSMDYEVFLLSRVREHYLATGDNDAAVVRGLSSTARVITSAALIMVSVFAGFLLSEDPTTKMFGLGLATAIAVDATIVRTVLVPATMKLMGDANWWLPAWLDRLLPTLDLEGGPVGDGPVEDEPGSAAPRPAGEVAGAAPAGVSAPVATGAD
ncbi:MAG: MMPL family transporter [Actinomycetota bacterium]|nr:MMPL family transporter [Actinomycetota bacterium]